MNDIFSDVGISKQEFEEREQEVLQHLQQIVRQLHESRERALQPQPIYLTSVLLMMVYADVFSRILYVFEGKEQKPKEQFSNRKRFMEWTQRFVMTQDNRHWKKYSETINCNVRHIWKLRNSLLHFYGFPPKASKDERLALQYGNQRSNTATAQAIDTLGGRRINIHALEYAVGEGARVQLRHMQQVQEQDPKAYAHGILRLYEVFQNEAVVEMKNL